MATARPSKTRRPAPFTKYLKMYPGVKDLDGPKSPEKDSVCVLCFDEAKIFAVGSCDHPFCHRCFVRLRILADDSNCPVCRQPLPKPILMRKVRKYDSSLIRKSQYDEKIRAFAGDSDISAACHLLLRHACPICAHLVDSFDNLKTHVKKVHSKHFCQLCTPNLTLFSEERKAYSREELGRHNRVGDADDFSHKGHPLCRFCDTRYFDNDDLLGHLRREHFFCYICDKDGLQDYYCGFPELREHCKAMHYVCEIGQCAKEPFSGVFRNELLHKAHVAKEHAKGKEARNMRTLTVAVNFSQSGEVSEFSIEGDEVKERQLSGRRAFREERSQPPRRENGKKDGFRNRLVKNGKKEGKFDKKPKAEEKQGKEVKSEGHVKIKVKREPSPEIKPEEENHKVKDSKDGSSEKKAAEEKKAAVESKEPSKKEDKDAEIDVVSDFPALAEVPTAFHFAGVMGTWRPSSAVNSVDYPSLLSAVPGKPLSKGPPPGFQSVPSKPPPPPGFGAPRKSGNPPQAKSHPVLSDILHIDQFKAWSGLFLQGKLSADDYYVKCCGLIGKEEFDLVFKELVDSLPDSEKRAELKKAKKDAKQPVANGKWIPQKVSYLSEFPSLPGKARMPRSQGPWRKA